MLKRLDIPRVAPPRERGRVLWVDAVGVGEEGPFVVVDGERWGLPAEFAKWAALAAAFGTRGLIEIGWRPERADTRDHGYYVRELEDEVEPPAVRRGPRRGS